MNKSSSIWRVCLYTVPALFAAVSFAGLIVAAVIASPAPPPTPPDTAAPGKPAKQAKAVRPVKFPLSLYAHAEEGDYTGGKNCTNCHKTAEDSFERSPHAIFMRDPHNGPDKTGCEGCHGPSKQHVAHRKEEEGLYQNVISYAHSKPEEIAAACLRCHNDTLTESHWKRTEHAHAGVSCTTCHQIHWADRLGKERIVATSDVKNDKFTADLAKAEHEPIWPNQPDPKALLKTDETTLCGVCHRKIISAFRQNFHHPVPEGRLICSDCHSVHPNKDERKNLTTTKQACITCHADKAGPFVFEHDPTSFLSGDGCVECHNPHGSPNPALLTSFSRGLCIKCHTDKSVNHNPGRTCWDSGCHSAIHGSNHNALFFQR
jgi:predicted CXXCH cytochrome family protein